LPTAGLFGEWGNDLCASLIALEKQEGMILASGGIRTGIDVAKVISLGAKLAGLALPFIRAEKRDGQECILREIDKIAWDLKTVMVLTASENISALSRAGLIIDSRIRQTAEQLLNNGNWRNNGITP
jgi:isopentenyl-diphosphate Delta-isomerase